MQLLIPLLLLLGPVRGIFPGTWDEYILAPSNRTLLPAKVHKRTGNVNTNSQGYHVLKGPNATITYDFGQEVAGIPTITYGTESTCGSSGCPAGLPAQNCTGTICNALGLAYSELATYAGVESDHSTFYTIPDGTVFLPIQTSAYTVPAKWGRGGFRYLTLSLGASSSNDAKVVIQALSLHYSPEPSITEDAQLQNYTGYFYSSDDLLNRIWYAGVYTSQLCLVGANSSVNHSYLLSGAGYGWSQDATVINMTGADTILSDGAKRDRNPWSGDLEISLRTAMLSRNVDNLAAVKNSLIGMLEVQDPATSYFPWGGSPFFATLELVGVGYDSDTYNLWTIIGFANYVLVSGDTAFANQYWDQILSGLNAAAAFVDSQGLFNGTRTADWGRVGQGGENTGLNALFYGTLNQLSKVTSYVASDQSNNTKEWAELAARVKSAANEYLYDESAGLFYDNTTSAGHQLHPQDGNAMAIVFNLTNSASQATTIASNLASQWNNYGAPAPELPGYISPYISGIELMAQFSSNGADSSKALKLLRSEWGYMLSAFSHTTFAEGFASNGSLLYGFYTDSEPFISLAHGWSTGPTYSLLAYVVGLQASPLETAGTGVDWIFAPSAYKSGLTHAEGGYALRSGEYQGSWSLDDKTFNVTLSVPEGTTGTVMVPMFGHSGFKSVSLVVDGKAVDSATVSNGFAVVADVSGGQHTIVLEY